VFCELFVTAQSL